MGEFLAALAGFLAAHLVPALPAVRARLVGALGRGTYLALYSAASLALLAWLVAAARRADTVPLWNPAPWQGWVPVLAMPLALWLLIAGLAAPNALSVSLRRPVEGARAGIVGVTRHPFCGGS